MITNEDKKLLSSKGITEEVLAGQLERFKKGVPFLELSAVASTEKGVLEVSAEKESEYINLWNNYCQSGKSVCKFVPASGAATRMFKDLFAFLEADYNFPETNFEKGFFDNIQKFAFFKDLNECCLKNIGKPIDALIFSGENKEIVGSLLNSKGLNYGSLPKGLLLFHRYGDEAATPVEEHLKEGVAYAKGKDGQVNIHFTVSPEHRQLFETLVDEKVPEFNSKFNVEYSVSFSIQKPSTDTVAVDMNNEPFREDDGSLLFRPGGHGALIENLNDLNHDVVFIKNIDNVQLDQLRDIEIRYKKMLAGILVDVQRKVFSYLELLDSGKYTHEELLEVLYFLQTTLCVKNPETKLLEDAELVLYLKRKLDRPIRVCGMVKNVGEPGGGPFLALNEDGTISPQILESSQIDFADPAKKAMFEKGTHFNPVDLVCGIRDYRGNRFNLKDYVDENTGFISFKSKGGKELKALELPGLWNGAMSDWNTLFVEVPIETFNPVKTVNDLLRKAHLGH